MNKIWFIITRNNKVAKIVISYTTIFATSKELIDSYILCSNHIAQLVLTEGCISSVTSPFTK